jgi:acyl CoA:acetate/3-ketoacid CoA transferase beta subunit
VIVATTHLTRDGEPKLVRSCSCPLTGDRPADLVVTEHATFEVAGDGLRLAALASGTSLDWVRENTDARFTLAPGIEGSR